jgi:hypothetical protein
MRLDSQRLLEAAVREFSADWEVVGECSPVDLSDPSQWPSSSRSFQVTLRHRPSGAQKVLGRRTVADAAAGCHRGLAHLVLQAYAERNTDPIRRYFDEVGIAMPTARQDGPPAGPWVALINEVREDQSRWLVIVQRHQPALYRHVQQELAGIERAQVIIDRRFGSRRRVKRSYRMERRRTPHDRRSQHAIDAELRGSGIVFVRLASTPAPVTPAHRARGPAAAASGKRAPRSWLRWRARLLRG